MSNCGDSCGCKTNTDIDDMSLRFNIGKPQLSYILEFDHALNGIAKVMEMGAEKYDRGNWKIGLPKEQLLDSLMRHLVHLANGDSNDDESGLPHIHHVLANALFYAYHHEPE